MLTRMACRIWVVLHEEKGIETLEWILMGALIVALGIAVYPGQMNAQLTAAITAVGAKIVGAV